MLVAKKRYSYNQYDRLDEKEPNKKIKKNKKRKKRNLNLKVGALLWGLIISAALILILLRYTEITEAKYKVYSLNKEIKQLEDNLQDKKVELDSLMRSDIIEEAAVNQLNMQYPQYEQMVFLDVGNENDLDLTVLEENTLTNGEASKEHTEEKNIIYYFKTSIEKLYSLLD